MLDINLTQYNKKCFFTVWNIKWPKYKAKITAPDNGIVNKINEFGISPPPAQRGSRWISLENLETKSKSFCSSYAMITFAKLPKPRPPIFPPIEPPSPRVHLTVDRILWWSYDHAWPPSETPRRLARTAERAAPCVHVVCIPRLPHHGNNTHTRRINVAWKKRGAGGESGEVVGTMHYGSQKIRDPDMRAWHVSRQINEGA